MQRMRYGGSSVVELLRAEELVELLHAMALCFFCRHASYVYVCGMSYSASKAPLMSPAAKKKNPHSCPSPCCIAYASHTLPYAPIRTHTHPNARIHTSYAPHTRPGPSTCVPSCTSYVPSTPTKKIKKFEGEARRRPHTYIYMM